MATLKKLIPNVFYTDMRNGLDLFVETLGFTVVYSDPADKPAFCIVKRDEITVHLVEDAVFAAKDRPEIRLETDDIGDFYEEVKTRRSSLFHPNLAQVKQQSWGSKEFALQDKEGTCIIIQQ